MEKLSIHISEFYEKTIISCAVPLNGEFNNVSPILGELKNQLSLYKEGDPAIGVGNVKKNFPENNKVLTILEELMRSKTIEEISGVHWSTHDGKNILIVIR